MVVLEQTTFLLTTSLIVLVGWFVVALYQWIRKPFQSQLQNVQGPPSLHWFFGSLPMHRLKNGGEAEQVLEWIDQYGGVFSYRLMNRQPTLVLADRKAVVHCFLKQTQTFVKARFSLRMINLFFGRGLVGVDGPEHKRDRKVAFPAFTQKAVENLVPLFVTHGQQLCARWDRLLEKQKQANASSEQEHKGIMVDTFHEFSLTTLDVIGEAGFNYKFNSVNGGNTELAQVFDELFSLQFKTTIYRLLRFNFDSVGKVGSYLVSEEKQMQQLRSKIHNVAQSLIDQAKNEALENPNNDGEEEQDNQAKDLLTLLVRSNLSPNVKPSERMTDAEMVHMVPTFLSAGHETTSTALCWCSYALTSTRDGLRAQQRLRQELIQNPGWNQNAKSLDALPYLDAVVKETLRLYSPILMLRRDVVRHDTIPLQHSITLKNGTTTNSIPVVPGDNVLCPIRWLNTHTDCWGDDGKQFVPERWLQESHPYFNGGLPDPVKDIKFNWSHLETFSTGPRNCIGMRFAILEFKAVLGETVEHFEFHRGGDKPLPIGYRTTPVARPFILGREDEGCQMPIRIQRVNIASQP